MKCKIIIIFVFVFHSKNKSITSIESFPLVYVRIFCKPHAWYFWKQSLPLPRQSGTSHTEQDQSVRTSLTLVLQRAHLLRVVRCGWCFDSVLLIWSGTIGFDFFISSGASDVDGLFLFTKVAARKPSMQWILNSFFQWNLFTNCFIDYICIYYCSIYEVEKHSMPPFLAASI